MSWTTEIPKVSGWYWVAVPELSTETDPSPLWVSIEAGAAMVYYSDDGAMMASEMQQAKWCPAVPPPKEVTAVSQLNIIRQLIAGGFTVASDHGDVSCYFCGEG